MNIILSIDDRVVADARRIAADRGTSLNQLDTEDMQPGCIVGRLTLVNPFDGIGPDA